MNTLKKDLDLTHSQAKLLQSTTKEHSLMAPNLIQATREASLLNSRSELARLSEVGMKACSRSNLAARQNSLFLTITHMELRAFLESFHQVPL